MEVEASSSETRTKPSPGVGLPMSYESEGMEDDLELYCSFSLNLSSMSVLLCRAVLRMLGPRAKYRPGPPQLLQRKNLCSIQIYSSNYL